MKRRSLHCPTRPRSPNAGFTLIELMVTLTVAAILMAVAIPSLQTFVQNDRQWTQANSMVMSLNAARSEAIKQNVPGGVTVCASSDGATCSGASWSQGWVVINPTLPAGTPVMSIPALPTGSTLTEAGAATQVVFQSNGMITAPALLAFKMCDSRGGSYARYLQVSKSGRVASSQTPGHALDGTALACP